MLVFLDRPDIAAGEALAGLLRPGNAGSNTAADHLTVGSALDSLPPSYRPHPDNPDAPQVLIRSDSAGATGHVSVGHRSFLYIRLRSKRFDAGGVIRRGVMVGYAIRVVSRGRRRSRSLW